MKKQKTFFVVSALKCDSSQLGHLIRHDTEIKAVDHAKSVIDKRYQNCQAHIEFFTF